MNLGMINTTAARHLLDEIRRCGVRDVCLSPGGRSTPLAAALAAEPRLRPWLVTDERSAAYFAVGLALASARPVALICTSGTAVANFAPAVAEAFWAEVPLLVLTADRPPELRDCGAPQTIRQDGIFGHHVKWSVELAPPDPCLALEPSWRAVACRAVARAIDAPAGPVHLNVPFREPLVAQDDTLDVGQPRPGDAPWTAIHSGRHVPDLDAATRFAERAAAARGWIVCGPRTPLAAAGDITKLATRLGWPIFADPLSGLRYGPAAACGLVIDAYDVLLRDPRFAREHPPDVVLRFGAPPTSKPLQNCLALLPAHQVLAGAASAWGDPAFRVAEVWYGDAAELCRAIVRAVGSRPACPRTWSATWLTAAQRLRCALDARLAREPTLFEGAIPAHLLAVLPAGANLVVGNSMPVRDLDTFTATTTRPLRVFANRGANGIDGVVSTALGIAAASQAPTYLLIGDLSFLHDLSGLQIAARHGLDLCVVVSNNDGGGIFSYLPQARLGAGFEPFFGTPHGLDLSPAVRMCGGAHVRAEAGEAIQGAISAFGAGCGLHVIEVPTRRDDNVVRHRQIIADALSEMVPSLPEVA